MCVSVGKIQGIGVGLEFFKFENGYSNSCRLFLLHIFCTVVACDWWCPFGMESCGCMRMETCLYTAWG